MTAPWVALALLRRPGFAISRVFVVWNLLGILDLVVAVSVGGLSSAFASGAPGEVTTGPMAQLPLVLIPAYLVPLFVILHLAALFQARSDGSLRNIEDVRAGDLVRNAKTGVAVKVGKVIEGPEALPLIRFGFEGTTVTTSQAHPVLTGEGLKPTNQLKKGDTIFDAQGHPHALTILETLPIEEGQRVINVDLVAVSSDANDRLLISDGIITGDIVLQGLLKEKK